MQSSYGNANPEPDGLGHDIPELVRARSATAPRTRLGRSGLRSRAGCVTCKQRHVRCDEARPVCGHCVRLQLACQYKPPALAQRWRQQAQSNDEGDAEIPITSTAGQSSFGDVNAGTDGSTSSNSGLSNSQLPRRSQQKNLQHAPETTLPASFAPYSTSDYATPTSNQQQSLLLPGSQPRRYDFNDIFSDLDTSWAGEAMGMFPDAIGPSNPSSFPLDSISGVDPQFETFSGLVAVDNVAAPENNASEISRLPRSSQRCNVSQPSSSTTTQRLEPKERRASMNEDSARLIHLFRKIVQPPAAILIGGFERWRRLQNYLCKLSSHSRAVRNSLLCVIELLMMDSDAAAGEGQQDKDACMKRILERHATACDEILAKISNSSDLKAKTRENLLAAIFLLSWFEVIRDQDAAHSSLFPRHLADIVITGETTWGRYSQQLLSWLNTLDNKASHLGGDHLLSPKSLEVVLRFPTQITSSLEHGENSNNDSEDSDYVPADMSPGEYSHHSPDDVNSRPGTLSMTQVKQVMLNTILQPALEWYLTSQSYCRRISAHDKHHRRRFTSDDEYEVITACKQLECALFELWDYRPAVISVAAEHLLAVVSPDIAKRLEEIFSVYLASFWILFVYLHRVSWWNLPHSALATRALTEVWQNMQRAYGEEVNGPLRKVIHPSLLWPLFLFGSECPDHSQRMWAVEQLEALGEAKPVLQSERTDADTLPPFKLSSGATRNAKRAAALLTELIKEQDAKQARVDDRDLSMHMFGCYFSIV